MELTIEREQSESANLKFMAEKFAPFEKTTGEHTAVAGLTEAMRSLFCAGMAVGLQLAVGCKSMEELKKVAEEIQEFLEHGKWTE